MTATMTPTGTLKPQNTAPPPARLSDMLRRAATHNPAGIALREAGSEKVICYADLTRAMETTAQWMTSIGVRMGDRVVIVNENSITAVILLFAASEVGAWPSLINARMSAREVDEISAHAQPRRVFFTTDVSPEAVVHAERHNAEPHQLLEGCLIHVGPEREAVTEPVTGDPEKDTAVIVYTSGTTGSPKGVMLSHRGAIYVASSPGSQRPTGPEDIVYCALPISHIYGLTSTLLRGIYGSATVWVVPRFTPAHAIDALSSGGVSVFQGVPQMYAAMLEYARLNDRVLSAPDLRFATIGGANVEPDLKAAGEAALGCRLTVGYGMTEFASTVSRSLPNHIGKDTCAGPPLPGIEVRVLDEAGRSLPVGSVGELALSGPNQMLGYYRNEDATRSVLTEDGWYRTGDLGRVDEAGNIYFAERTRDVVIRSGFNVYPVEVEAVLTAHPDITLAAVVGREVTGNEEVVAFVQLVPGCSLDMAEIAEWCSDRLAPYKRPSEIITMNKLPAAPTGKILKAQLRDMARGTAA